MKSTRPTPGSFVVSSALPRSPNGCREIKRRVRGRGAGFLTARDRRGEGRREGGQKESAGSTLPKRMSERRSLEGICAYVGTFP
mmetsp:Transcript_2957/g.9969  ORF Transcript_2957/g.9969 Transcript_2957/m.9969 type:complete len:84 (-) Transcript_2957:3-254(-)